MITTQIQLHDRADMRHPGKRADRHGVLVRWQVVAETAVDNISAAVGRRLEAAKYRYETGGENNLHKI